MKNFSVERHAAQFTKYSDRPPIASARYPPNEKRFDNFDRSPRIHSHTIYQGNYRFERQLPRAVEKTIFPVKDYQCEYENVDK